MLTKKFRQQNKRRTIKAHKPSQHITREIQQSKTDEWTSETL